MHNRTLFASALAIPFVLLSSVTLNAAALPVLDDKPTPLFDAGGPSAAVTALAFDAEGETLFAAGLDKVVRVWTLRQGRFVLTKRYRVPIGPGNAGGVNALALSPDGAWLAMAGRAPMRGEAGYRQDGIIVEAAALSPEQYRDAGVIYVARLSNPAGGKVLRGHRGEVRTLAFAPGRKGKPPVLVSAATERDGGRHFGGLRLWNAESGELLAERNDLPSKVTRPGLAVWNTGAEARQVRVAVAWPQSNPKLFLWDPAPGADPLQRWTSDQFGGTAALLEKEGGVTVLAGGFGPNAGRLREWSFSADRDTSAETSTVAEFPPRDQVQWLPVSLTVVPNRDGTRYAAVILQPSNKSDFHLALVDLRTRRVVAEVPLTGSDTSQLPAVAARGGHVVVAATLDHAIRVYKVADLIEGKTEPADLLTGASLAPHAVAFTDRGRSLWLSEKEGPPLKDGLLFDIDKRQVRANDKNDLAADAPELGDWSVSIAPDRKSVSVRQGEKEHPPVRLSGKTEVVTAAALRPAARGKPGVLAVAYTELDANRTLILLCDPAVGKPYRLLVNHLQNVRGLAFSASRPLLASVADDQTVCVWGLADLDRTVGLIPGLGVEDDGDKVVIRRIEPGTAVSKTALAVGDVLRMVGAPGGKAKPVKDAADFLLNVAAHRPGDQLEVTAAGKAAVKLTVERGVDERKPLFSLLLLRVRGALQWVGWSPAGPYDYSGPDAEAHLGWHTNTGDPTAPVSWVEARVHQKDFFRKGILGYLAAEADLGRALRTWEKANHAPPPEAALRFLRPEVAMQGNRDGEFVVRQPVKSLRIGINSDYPLNDRQVLRWQVTRAGADALSGQAVRDGREWLVDLSGVQWQRGEFRVEVSLHAAGRADALDRKTAIFRFQPPAPVLTLRRGNEVVTSTEEKPLEVMQDRLALRVALTAPARQEVELRFAQERNGEPQKDVPAARSQSGSGESVQEFKLPEGLNRLVVRAVNKGALAGHEAEEAAEADVWVRYKVKRELPPRVSAWSLTPEPEQKRLEDGKELWVVNRSAVRLTAKIEAEGVLVQVDWSAGGAAKSALPQGEMHAAEIVADLRLKPGEIVPVRVRAKSKFSAEKTAEQRVVFFPPLPDIAADALDSPTVLTDKIALTGSYRTETDDPFELIFRVSPPQGQAKSFRPVVDGKTHRWKVELTLFPGENRVEAFVANKWRPERAVEGALQLKYLRPPTITAFPARVEAVETNRVRLELTVEGPAGHPLTALTVDQKSVRYEAAPPATKGDRWIWKVVLPEVFVNDGDHNLDQVSLRAITDEGESQAAIAKIVHIRIPRRPSARFIKPAESDTSRRPEYRVVFRVESELPLERVEIRRDDKVVYQADLKKVVREGTRQILDGAALLTLTNGANPFELVAVNADGRSPRAGIVIGYSEPAVLVRIDRIELQAEDGTVQQVLAPEYRDNGDVNFPTIPRSLVWLVGRVRWSDPKAAALDDRGLEVAVKVGDCRQFPLALGPRGKGDAANVRPFKVPVVLIGAQNHIKIEVPTVGQQELSCGEFEVACGVPAAKQRLHVLIVGVNVKDAAELKKRVLDALAVESTGRPLGAQGEFFKKPPFERCVLYHVLVGEVDRGKVEAQLVEINNEIRRLKHESGWLNDLVLIYYQGRDLKLPGKNERWLLTSRNFQFPKAPAQRFAIPCHALPRVPGAPLLLLNVTGPPDLRAAGRDWGGDADTGFMRYAYSDPAEVQNADPAFLGLLQEAVRKKGRLGEVVQYVNDLLSQKPAKYSPLIVLDKDQADRRINVPGH